MDAVTLPGGREIVQLTTWLFKLQDGAATLPDWYEHERGKTNTHIPLYRRSEENFGLEPLPDSQVAQIWRAVLQHCLRAQHDPLVFLGVNAPVESNLYLDIKDIAKFCEATGLTNVYADTTVKTNTRKELPRSAHLVIGALCDLYWRTKHPSDTRINQSTIIGHLVKYDIHGMGERNLKDILSSALKAFEKAKNEKE